MRIEILNWERYNGRRQDSKSCTWFRFQNNFFSSGEMRELTVTQRYVWVCFLCQASIENGGSFWLSVRSASELFGVEEKTIESTLAKLEEIQYVRVTSRATSRETFRRTVPTDGRTDEQTNERTNGRTDGPNGDEKSVPFLPPPPSSFSDVSLRGRCLFEAWNQHKGQMRTATVFNRERQKMAAERWKEFPDFNWWVAVIKKMADIPFFLGKNKKGWLGNFDWLMREGNALRIYEGSCDDFSVETEKKKQVPVKMCTEEIL